MNQLIAVSSREDIFPQYNETPIGLLLEYQNMDRTEDQYDSPQLIIGTCMDYRIDLHIPRNFAYIIRDGGANMRHNEFYLSYAIAIGKIKHIALIGHNNCAMADIHSVKDDFIAGLTEISGMNHNQAGKLYQRSLVTREIGNEIQFIHDETNRLRQLYPKIIIAPLMYILEENKLFQISE